MYICIDVKHKKCFKFDPKPWAKKVCQCDAGFFMMGSLEERMLVLNRIIVDSKEDFIIDIKHNGITIAELICGIKDIEYSLNTGKSSISLSVFNPNNNHMTIYDEL